MKVNAVTLREKMKFEIMSVISKYEKNLKAPIFLTRSVLENILNEVKSIEMQEVIMGEMADGEQRKKENTDNNEKK